MTPRIYASDEVQYFSYLRSLYFDHDVSFENEYRYFYDRNIAQSGGFHETFLERAGEAHPVVELELALDRQRLPEARARAFSGPATATRHQ